MRPPGLGTWLLRDGRVEFRPALTGLGQARANRLAAGLAPNEDLRDQFAEGRSPTQCHVEAIFAISA